MIDSLNFLDFIILFILSLSVLFGFIKGLLRELLSIAFFIVAVIMAFLFYLDAGKFLSSFISSKEIAYFVGFISIFVMVIIIGILVTYYVKKVFIIGPLKPIDRILGGVFGLLRGILMSAVLVFGFITFSVNKEWINHSRLTPYVVKSIDVFYDLLPDTYKQKLKIIKENEPKNRQLTDK